MEEKGSSGNREENISQRLGKTIKEFWEYAKGLMHLETDTEADATETIQQIEKSVVFKGTNLWVLIFSVLVCSVGLNINSTAVVIGAMLISPLLGPIMGIGLGVGINDLKLIKNPLLTLEKWYPLQLSLLPFTSTSLHYRRPNQSYLQEQPPLSSMLL